MKAKFKIILALFLTMTICYGCSSTNKEENSEIKQETGIQKIEDQGIPIYYTKESLKKEKEEDVECHYGSLFHVFVDKDMELYGEGRIRGLDEETLAYIKLSKKPSEKFISVYPTYQKDYRNYKCYQLALYHNSIEVTPDDVMEYIHAILSYTGIDDSHIKAVYMSTEGIHSYSGNVFENYVLMGDSSRVQTFFRGEYESSDGKGIKLDIINDNVYINNYSADGTIKKDYITMSANGITIEGKFVQNIKDNTLIIKNDKETYRFKYVSNN